eukprot:scaffold160330_cov21-Tisochrysis_lutea.AAC.1
MNLGHRKQPHLRFSVYRTKQDSPVEAKYFFPALNRIQTHYSAQRLRQSSLFHQSWTTPPQQTGVFKMLIAMGAPNRGLLN